MLGQTGHGPGGYKHLLYRSNYLVEKRCVQVRLPDNEQGRFRNFLARAELSSVSASIEGGVLLAAR